MTDNDILTGEAQNGTDDAESETSDFEGVEVDDGEQSYWLALRSSSGAVAQLDLETVSFNIDEHGMGCFTAYAECSRGNCGWNIGDDHHGRDIDSSAGYVGWNFGGIVDVVGGSDDRSFDDAPLSNLVVPDGEDVWLELEDTNGDRGYLDLESASLEVDQNPYGRFIARADERWVDTPRDTFYFDAVVGVVIGDV